MALEIRRGRVEGLESVGRPQGRGRVSVAIFRLNGMTAEFRGDGIGWKDDPVPPPFREGDEIAVAGPVNRKGILEVYAARVPGCNETLGEPPVVSYILGLLLGGIMSFIGIAFLHRFGFHSKSAVYVCAILATSWLACGSVLRRGTQVAKARKILLIRTGRF